MRECGQTSVEWLAVIAAVVTLTAAAAVGVPSVAAAVTGAVKTDICTIAGGSCDSDAASAAQQAQPAPATSPPDATPAPQDLARDLCGSSYFNVPELWFTSACEGHDRCYAAHRGKAACDTAFLNDMLATCAGLRSSSGGVNSNVTRASCRAAAHLYYKGVVVGGGFAYCHRPVCREQ